ncbi:zinc finger, CCHC-type containing protein, partial [Tanacetum coccineum]
YFAFGWHLDDLHVTWAHLEKKRTRLRTNTKILEDISLQTLETVSEALHDAVTAYQATASQDSQTASARTDSKADLEDSFHDGVTHIKTAKPRNDILMFQQHHGESLLEAWTRFKDLLQNVSHHGIDLWLQVQIFYDQSASGTFHDRNAEESWALLEDLALYDN